MSCLAAGLVVTMEGYTVSDKSGCITERGRFPRPAGAPAITWVHAGPTEAHTVSTAWAICPQEPLQHLSMH